MLGIRAGRLARGFDVASLVSDVATVQVDEWEHILDGDKWSSWTGAALLSHDGRVKTLTDGPSFIATPLLQRSDAFRRLLDFFQCPLRRARVMRLAAGGGQVHEHSDEMPEGALLARLHLPLAGALQTDFSTMGMRVPMAAGELWYVDVTRPHSVINRGGEDRLTLVIDCEVNSWMETLIANSECQMLDAASR